MGLFSRSTPPDVEKLRVAVNISGLIKALKFKDDRQVRKDAAAALKELNPRGKKDQKKIFNYFVNAISSAKKEVIEDAIEIISTSNSELLDYLESIYANDLDSWKELTTILSEINTDESVGFLAFLLDHMPNYAVKYSAIHALKAIGNPKAVFHLQFFSEESDNVILLLQLNEPVNDEFVNNWKRDDSNKTAYSMLSNNYLSELEEQERRSKNRDEILFMYRLCCKEAIEEIQKGTQPSNIFKLWVKDTNPSRTYLIALLIKICKEDPDRVPKKFHEINEKALNDDITINIKPSYEKEGSDVEFIIK